MKNLLFSFIIVVGLFGLTSLAYAADPVEATPTADTTPPEADLQKENADLKDRVLELEAEVVKLTPKPAPPAPPAPEPNFWNFKYNLDVSFFDGNSESLLIDHAINLVFNNLEDWKAQFLFVNKFLLQGDKTAEHLGNGMLKVNYYADPMFSPYGYTKHGWQESTKTHYFAELGLGVEWIFARDPYSAGEYGEAPNYQFKISVGALYEYLQYADSAVKPIGRNIRLEIQLDGEYYIAGNLMFGMMVNFKPNVEAFDTDYVAHGIFWLDWVYDKNTRFKLTYEIMYKSITAAATIKNADHILKAGVEITFGWR